jgi:hypothetical protein
MQFSKIIHLWVLHMELFQYVHKAQNKSWNVTTFLTVVRILFGLSPKMFWVCLLSAEVVVKILQHTENLYGILSGVSVRPRLGGRIILNWILRNKVPGNGPNSNGTG